MKKMLALLLALAMMLTMMLSFAACSDEDAEDAKDAAENVQDAVEDAAGAVAYETLPYKDAINAYLDYYYKGDFSLVNTLTPAALWTEYAHLNVTAEDVINFNNENKDAIMPSYFDWYATSYTVTLVSTDKLTGDDLVEAAGLEGVTAEEGYEVTFDMVTTNGTETDEHKHVTVDVYKIDGTYYTKQGITVVRNCMLDLG